MHTFKLSLLLVSTLLLSGCDGLAKWAYETGLGLEKAVLASQIILWRPQTAFNGTCCAVKASKTSRWYC